MNENEIRQEIRQEIAEKKERIEDLLDEWREQEANLDCAQNRQAEIVNTKERYEEDENIEEYEAEMDEAQGEIDDAKEKRTDIEEDISELENEIFELEKKLDDLGRVPREALEPDHPGQMKLFGTERPPGASEAV